MGSESLFTKCRACGKEIAKSAKSCPKCGAKCRRLSFFHWMVIAFFALIMFAFVETPDSKTVSERSMSEVRQSPVQANSQDLKIPEKQALLLNVIAQSASDFRGAKNELQQSAIRDQRKSAISAALGDYTVQSWIGTISQLQTNSEGKAILSVRISPNVEIETWNNAVSDMMSNTLIEKGSQVYISLLDLSPGQMVRVSGEFFPSETDFIEEQSLTINGSMLEPEFLFKFLAVTPIN